MASVNSTSINTSSGNVGFSETLPVQTAAVQLEQTSVKHGPNGLYCKTVYKTGDTRDVDHYELGARALLSNGNQFLMKAIRQPQRGYANMSDETVQGARLLAMADQQAVHSGAQSVFKSAFELCRADE